MKPGHCINIPVGRRGPRENGSNGWLEPVDDEQYGELK